MTSFHPLTIPQLTRRNLVIITNQVRPLSQPLDNQIMSLNPTVDIPDIIGRSLEVAGRVVALGDEDVVVDAAFEGLVEWDWWALIETLV